MSQPSQNWESGLGIAVGLLGLALISLDLQPWTLDDAYISFRYAENFAAGHGLVYNPGESVEGYTTFLWVFLLGLGNAVGLDTRMLAKVLGLGFAALTVVGVALAHRVVDLPQRGTAVAAAWLGTGSIFAAWAMPGMEVPLVALLLLGTSLAALSERWALAGVCGALAMMARPDSIVVVGLWVGWACWRRGFGVVTVGVYLPYFLWRWVTYGWLLPNTFYAKVGATEAQLWRGVDYVWAFGLAAGLLVLPGLFGKRGLLGIFVAHALYVVSVGGDVMPAFRFLAPVLPLALLAAGAGVARLPGTWVAVVAVLGVLVNGAAYKQHGDLERRIRKGVVGLRGEEVGNWLRAHAPERSVLATNTAGSVPYFSGLRTIDMLGLNDAHIAHTPVRSMGKGRAGHEKADGAYVFSRSPDIVQFGSARGRAKPGFRSDRELFRQPGFEDRYRLERVQLPSGAWAVFWVKKDLRWR